MKRIGAIVRVLAISGPHEGKQIYCDAFDETVTVRAKLPEGYAVYKRNPGRTFSFSHFTDEAPA